VVADLLLPPLTGYRVLTAWQPAPLADGALGALACGYLAGIGQVRRRHPRRPWPVPRALAFFFGLAVTAVAVQAVPAVYDGALFSMHMVQHVLLIMVAPPLLVLGRPVTLLLHAVRNPAHTWVKRAVRSRLVTAATWPPAGTAIYAAVVVGTHTPPVMDLVVRNEAVHALEHVLYLAAGYLFFLVIIGSEPVRWRVPIAGRIAMLLVAMQVDTVVGVVFMVAGHELFPAYARPALTSAAAPLTDLHRGGIIMWAGSDVVMAVITLALAVALVLGPAAAREATHAGPGRRAARGRAPVFPAAAVGDGDEARLAAYNSYLATLGRAAARRDRALPPRCGSGPVAAAGGFAGDREEQRDDRHGRELPVEDDSQADDQHGEGEQGDAVAVGHVPPPGPVAALAKPDGHGDEFHEESRGGIQRQGGPLRAEAGEDRDQGSVESPPGGDHHRRPAHPAPRWAGVVPYCCSRRSSSGA
jgi:putative copper resistance protein D